MTSFIIIGNYFKTSFRNMAKNKTFTVINVIGLAISISVGLIMITFINEVNSYDDFHRNYDRIYRVNNIYQYLDDDPSYFASTSVSAGKKIEEGITGINNVALMRRNFSGDFGTDDKKLPLDGIWASQGFFDVFSFKMIKGNPVTALKDPYSLILTESAAVKLFGEEDAFGKIISRNEDEQYTINGIVEDPPANSTLDFEVLGSFVTYENQVKDNTRFMRWSNMWMYHVYFTIDEGYDIANIQTVFDTISKEENAKDEYTKIDLSIQAMGDIIPGPDLSNEIGKNMDASLLWMLAGLTFIVIVSACFNYTNLSIARSLRRSKEIGIRKVIGARSEQIFGQFIFESIIVAMLGLVFAIGLFYFIKPKFMAMDSFIQELVTLEMNGTILFQFVLLAAVTGILAGFAPAFFFSRLNPQSILKNSSSIKLFKGVGLKKVLIVFQFTLSLMFVLAATIEYKQYRYALSFDLGYNTENVLNMRLLGNDIDILKNELSQLPDIQEISTSMMITSVGSYWGETVKYQDPMDSASTYFNGIDEYYLPLHGHNLLAGANFKPLKSDSGQIQVIVNEKLLDRFAVPKGEYGEAAIGEVLKWGRDDEAVIVGVMKDFHYGTIESDIRPFLFRYGFGEDEAGYLNLKIVSTDMLATMDKIEAIWNKVDDIHPMEARFYDERIQETYSEYVIMVKIIGFLAFLAITIAVMGLLGMVIFTTETRLKEISIRKVLGASEGKLVVLLGRGFMTLLLISSILAIPTTYYLFDQIVFSGIDYRAEIGAIELFSGTAFVMLLALLAVGTQTIHAARTNPATTLRNE